jgi:hypothetical protein
MNPLQTDVSRVGAHGKTRLSNGYTLNAFRGASARVTSGLVETLCFFFIQKQLERVGDPRIVIEFLDVVGFVIRFSCANEVGQHKVPHSMADSLARHRPTLALVEGFPQGLDLSAVPPQHLLSVH